VFSKDIMRLNGKADESSADQLADRIHERGGQPREPALGTIHEIGGIESKLPSWAARPGQEWSGQG